MQINEKKLYIIQIFFNKGENASQASEMANIAYGVNTVTAIYAQYWCQFRIDICWW